MNFKQKPVSLIFLCLLLLSTGSVYSEGKIVYQQDFSGIKDGTDLSELGWSVDASGEQSLWKVKDGHLEVTCLHNPYNGGVVRKKVPLVRRGMLEFDANIAMKGKGNAKGLAFTIEIYNIGTWFHDSCKDWRRYFPAPSDERMPGYRIEPVGHKSLITVKKEEWAHYRIYFDADKGLVEYYYKDMDDPAYVDENVPVFGRAEYQGGYIRMANIGFVNGPVVYGVDNIVLTSLEGEEDF